MNEDTFLSYIAIILSSLSIALWILPLIGLSFSISALILCFKALYGDMARTKVALVLSGIGLIFSVINIFNVYL